MSSQARSIIDNVLRENKIVVFSKSYCPYCTKAKNALYQIIDKAKVYILEIEDRADMDALQDELSSMTGSRSVPRVFVDGEFIGGGDDTAEKVATGELKRLLDSKGIV